MNFTTFVTRKDTIGLIVDGHKFRKDKTREDLIYWRCCQTKCKARCSTDIAIKDILIPPKSHDHDRVPEKTIQLDAIRASCKRKATETETRASKIVCAEARQCSSIDLVDFHSLTNSVSKARLKSRPPLPKSRSEVFEAINEYDTPADGSLKILVKDKESGIMMISNEQNLNFLQSSQIFADGTFKYAPKHFLQLYTLHGLKNGIYAPCAFFLLPDKKEATYTKMFLHLKKVCEEMGFNFNIEEIHLDLEIAAHNAARTVLGDVRIKACAFHLSQAWYRRIQALGLSKIFKTKDSDSGRWMKMFFALPSLPINEVEDCFSFFLMANAPQDQRCEEFADYVLQNYLDSNTAKFPPTMWVHGGVTDNTTNACESFHNYFGDHFHRHSPNIFNFLEALQKEQSRTDIKIRQANKGNWRRRTRRREALKKSILLSYQSQEIDQETFLIKMSSHCQPVSL